MDFETALAFISGVFLLVGIVGKVEVQHLRLGTENRLARTASIAVGTSLLLIALGQKTDILRLNLGPTSTNTAPTTTGFLPAPSGQGYFIVVSSTRIEEEAVRRAKRLVERGYPAEAHHTSSGFLAVAVRAESPTHRSQLFSQLLREGLAGDDAFLSVGQRFRGKVYP